MFYDNRMDKASALRELRNRGIVKVEIPFSGGNDEGGHDGIKATDAAGKEVKIEDPRVYASYSGMSSRPTYMVGWNPSRPATADEIRQDSLINALTAPIDDQYGSFAGDFHVYGTVVWDVAAGTCVMDREEQSGYDHYRDEY